MRYIKGYKVFESMEDNHFNDEYVDVADLIQDILDDYIIPKKTEDVNISSRHWRFIYDGDFIAEMVICNISSLSESLEIYQKIFRQKDRIEGFIGRKIDTSRGSSFDPLPTHPTLDDLHTPSKYSIFIVIF